jgi:uncharacterized protein involved in outer membrane biogenesis
MKKFLRWSLYVLIALIVLVVIAFLSVDSIVKRIAQKRILAETGLVAEIGKFHIGFSDHSLTIKNFKLLNPSEFGGGTFVELPELHVEYDLEAIRSNVVHLRVVRIDLAALNVVENKDGKRNVDVLMKPAPRGHVPSAPRNPATTNAPAAPSLPFKFGGIDKLQVTLGATKYSSAKFPERSFDRDLGIKNEVFRDIKNEQDLQTVGIVLSLKAGLANLLQEKLF